MSLKHTAKHGKILTDSIGKLGFKHVGGPVSASLMDPKLQGSMKLAVGRKNSPWWHSLGDASNLTVEKILDSVQNLLPAKNQFLDFITPNVK